MCRPPRVERSTVAYIVSAEHLFTKHIRVLAKPTISLLKCGMAVMPA